MSSINATIEPARPGDRAGFRVNGYPVQASIELDTKLRLTSVTIDCDALLYALLRSPNRTEVQNQILKLTTNS